MQAEDRVIATSQTFKVEAKLVMMVVTMMVMVVIMMALVVSVVAMATSQTIAVAILNA